jgi:hypothetical protein
VYISASLRFGSAAMTDKPSESEDRMLTDDERDVQRRFQETLGRRVNTPHKPHAPLKPKVPKPQA